VFSPYYARQRRAGAADPEDFCALNVALYGAGRPLWAMTEHGRGHVTRTADTLRIGASRLDWRDGGLTIAIDEALTPGGGALRGTIRLDASGAACAPVPLDRGGLHRWNAIAPGGRVTMALDEPGLAWNGHGYFDTNIGDRPISDDFDGWDWARGADGEVFYESRLTDGGRSSFGMADGASAPHPGSAALPPSFWQLTRRAPADPGTTPALIATLEDTPFYARALIESTINGQRRRLMHETLDCRRLASGWVQRLLPFRMPRQA
jgi:carotenoid 1,2-hydratase